MIKGSSFTMFGAFDLQSSSSCATFTISGWERLIPATAHRSSARSKCRGVASLVNLLDYIEASPIYITTDPYIQRTR